MFQGYSRQQSIRQLFILCILFLIGIGMARSVSADSGPLFYDGIITGKIVDTAGIGVKGLSVSLHGKNQTSFFGQRSATTDADGNFTLSPIKRGSYQLRIRDYGERYAARYIGGGLQSNSATTFEVWNSTPIEVNETVQPGGYIEGTIRSDVETNFFSPVVAITYFDQGRGQWEDVDVEYIRTEFNGRYRIGGLPAGTYHVSAYEQLDGLHYLEYYDNGLTHEDATPVNVSSGGTTSGIDIVLAEGPGVGASIRGQVVSAETGLPLENMFVQLYRNFPENADWLPATASKMTDANGNYEFKQQPEGNYKVKFFDRDDIYATEYNGNKPTLGGAAELTATQADVVIANAELTVGATVRLGLTAPEGVYHNAHTMYAYRWNDHDAWLDAGTDYNDHPDGFFELTGLTDGRYIFKITGNYGNLNRFERYYGDTPTAEGALEVMIKAGVVYNLDPIELDVALGTLYGRVTDQTGQPVPFADVWIYEASDNSDRLDIVGLRLTDADGYFVNSRMSPGEYKVEIDSDAGETLRTFNGDVLEPDEAPWIRVDVNEEISADIKLRSGGSLQGHVTIDSTFAHDYARATAYRLIDGDWKHENSASVATDGRYNIIKLPPGEYKLYLSAGQYAPYPAQPFEMGEWVDDAASRDDAITFVVEEGLGQMVPEQHIGNIVASQSRTDGAISGQILSADWRSGEGFEARAYLKTFPPRGSAYWVLQTSVPVDVDGNYTLNGLLHGTYVVGFYDTVNEHKPEYYNNVADIDSATQLRISAEQPSISGINAILQLSQTHVK